MIRQKELIDLVKARIASGEYALRGLPSERDLADETGAARMTARRALQHLVDDGVLERGLGGRLQIAGNHHQNQPQIALLLPSIRSSNSALWVRDAQAATATVQANLRPMFYSSWDDLVLRDALDGMDGVFLLPRSDSPPEWLVGRLQKHHCPTVVLGVDWTHIGLPSLLSFQPIFIQQLLDSLYDLGHRRIDCLHAQDLNMSTKQRIEQWQFWCTLHRVEGQLICESAGDAFIERFARKLIRERLESKQFKATAIMCTTMPAALGAIRALADFGLKPGHDVSVCAVDGESLSDLSVPSITALERPDTKPYLAAYVEWMLSGEGKWQGADPMEISGIKLFQGESTGPAPQ